ncbi:hypothetical protein K466DRAFT_163604 [Polyporus arcularius HHB13444]|uniref:Uncharacterized protein n=1 Tax=Polyporus arcularius HHB13444 TaxID=1314778 RepID=A0A5C3PD10_9APHY|nr:hypothetical protein K466DRAFT_163604 [Polyporus arcularius HHB13444]
METWSIRGGLGGGVDMDWRVESGEWRVESGLERCEDEMHHAESLSLEESDTTGSVDGGGGGLGLPGVTAVAIRNMHWQVAGDWRLETGNSRSSRCRVCHDHDMYHYVGYIVTVDRLLVLTSDYRQIIHWNHEVCSSVLLVL